MVFVLVPLTFAVNVCWPLSLSVTFRGVTETASFEVIVILAEAALAVFCWLVAVIVTVVLGDKTAGAVYSPDKLRVPAPVAGDIDQVTPLFVALVTDAVSCNDLLRLTLAVFGEMLTLSCVLVLRRVTFGKWPD